MAIEALTGGVDWITSTADYPGDTYAFLRKNGLKVLEVVEAEGYERKERGMNGYTGVGCGNCFVGIRDDGIMVQFTGHHAHTAFREIYHAKSRIPRIDVQVTAKYSAMPVDVAKRAYASSSEWAEGIPKHMRTKVTLYTGNDGGDTTYVGSPISEQRGRIYNKEVQSEDPLYSKCWRWEVTFKNQHAIKVSGMIYRSGALYPQVCRGIVANWFASRGSKPEWADDNDLVAIEPLNTVPTDIERKLRWIEKQVAPTVRYLHSKGFGDIVGMLLGYSSPEQLTLPSSLVDRARKERDKGKETSKS